MCIVLYKYLLIYTYFYFVASSPLLFFSVNLYYKFVVTTALSTTYPQIYIYYASNQPESPCSRRAQKNYPF